jgi:hypothetical protein
MLARRRAQRGPNDHGDCDSCEDRCPHPVAFCAIHDLGCQPLA